VTDLSTAGDSAGCLLKLRTMSLAGETQKAFSNRLMNIHCEGNVAL